MLPSILSSSYSRYKHDTDAIAGWLATTAKRFGYVSTTKSKSTRKKGKERKATGTTAQQAHGRPSYTVAIKDFTVLAEFIAGKKDPEIKVPPKLAALLDRTITARRWFSSNLAAYLKDDQQKQESDNRHVFFLGILERVRDILKPCYSAAHVPVPAKPKDVEEVMNLFEHLQVEETSKEFNKAPDIVVVPFDPASSDADYKAERESEDMQEAFTALYFLLFDLNRLRTEVSRAWEGYKEGMVDLIAASITTNTAVDLARAMEDDMKDLLAKGGGADRMLELYYTSQCFAAGQTGPIPDELNFELYEVADVLFWPATLLLQAFCELLEVNPTPDMKQGFYGTYNPPSDRSTKSNREKFQEDKILLLEMLPEFLYHCRTTPERPAAEDELTRGLRTMFQTKKVTLSVAFATTMFLDIHHCLRDGVDYAFKRLADAADFVRNEINQNFEFHKDLAIVNWPRLNDNILKEFLAFIKFWIQDDPHRQAAMKMKRVNIPKPYHFYRQHPWICGLWKYHIMIRFHELSIVFVNAWGSIMSCAHLYNAVQSEKMLKQHWKDMEVIMSMQGTDAFFVGEPPHNPDDYLKRFGLAMGMSAVNLTPRYNRKSKRLVHSKRGPQSLKELGPVLQMFKERFTDPNARLNLRTEDVEKIIQQCDWVFETDEDDRPTVMVKDPDEAKKPIPKQLPAAKMLAHLVTMLHVEVAEISFDYLALHRFCWRLLRVLKDECQDQLIKMYGPNYIEKETELPFIVGYILMTASKTKQLGDLLKQQGSSEVTSAVLMKAADAVEEMLRSGAGEIVVGKILPSMLGVEIDFEYE
jgi:hypothetical protein